MTRKIVKALVTTVSLAALVLGTDPSMARGGGGHGGGGVTLAVAEVTSEVAERALAVRTSAAPAWARPGSVPLTSVDVISVDVISVDVTSAACRVATSLALTPHM